MGNNFTFILAVDSDPPTTNCLISFDLKGILAHTEFDVRDKRGLNKPRFKESNLQNSKTESSSSYQKKY